MIQIKDFKGICFNDVCPILVCDLTKDSEVDTIDEENNKCYYMSTLRSLSIEGKDDWWVVLYDMNRKVKNGSRVPFMMIIDDPNVFRVIKSPELVNEVGKASVSHAINVTPIECNLEVEYIKPGESD